MRWAGWVFCSFPSRPLCVDASPLLTMQIRIKRSVVVQGHPGVSVGDVVEVNAVTAAELIGIQAAVEHTGEPVKVEPVQAREPEIEHRDPEVHLPRKTRKKPL